METTDRMLYIIPDVHGRSFWRKALAEHSDAHFVFLGDYIDPYPSEGIDEDEAFLGLEDIIALKQAQPDQITLLWGNHDLHYLDQRMQGSRYDYFRAERNAHFFRDHGHLFQMAYETRAGGKRFLFSHAGVGKQWLYDCLPDLTDVSAEKLNERFGEADFMQALCAVSPYRGGLSRYGSMVWADVQEQMEPDNQLEGIIQVFGHTQLDETVNYKQQFYCLDCRACFCLDPVTAAITTPEGGAVKVI